MSITEQVQRIEKLLGESVREIGILVFVFAPLDAAFSEARFDQLEIAKIVGMAAGVIMAGIFLETALTRRVVALPGGHSNTLLWERTGNSEPLFLARNLRTEPTRPVFSHS